MKRHNQNSGPSQRQLRVGETIRRALASHLARGDVHDDTLARVSITVGEVRCSPDLKVATAFILPLGGTDAQAVLTALRKNRHELRRHVSRDLHLKFSPELRFELDRTFDQLDETRRLLGQDTVRRDVTGD